MASFFNEMFRKHTSEDAEILFISGTPYTTPELDEKKDFTPHPWLFLRILTVVFFLYIGFYIGLFILDNVKFLPGLILFGAFLVPVSILIFFWELNVPRNISIYKVVIFFLVGGLVSLLYSVLLYIFVDGNANSLMTGFIEETAKLLTILIFVSKSRYKYILNGLLIGAAVGAGFSAFESSGYILVIALQSGVKTMLQTIFWRAILAPGGHIAWAGLMGAAVILVKKNNVYRFRYLFQIKFLSIYFTVILLHTLWDTNLPQPFLQNIPIYPILYMLISWILLFCIIKKGIKQVSEITKKDELPLPLNYEI